MRWGWLLAGLLLLAQDDEGTSLSITGGLTTELDGSDANACVIEEGEFRAHLTSLTTSTTILTIELRTTSPGIFPVAAGNHVTLVSLSDDPDEFLTNWNGSRGTVTIGRLDARVASGSIEADFEDETHDPVHISGGWACHFPE